VLQIKDLEVVDVKNELVFEPKRTLIKAKKGPKTAFYLASNRGLRAEKALPGEPNGGLDELRIQPSGH
jgi:hypothetical protein